jgi:hypothetical protein
MPVQLEMGGYRRRNARLLLDIGRIWHEAIYRDTSNFGASLGGLFVYAAVVLGHAEGRYMTATKISLFLDIPRTTVLRRLDELIDLDWVVKKNSLYYVSPTRKNLSPAHALTEKILEDGLRRQRL